MKNKDGSGVYGPLLDQLGLPRICCRRMLLTHVEVIEDTVMYSSTKTVMDESGTIFNAFTENERTITCT